jgi:hypothetical protein
VTTARSAVPAGKRHTIHDFGHHSRVESGIQPDRASYSHDSVRWRGVVASIAWALKKL